MKYHQYQSENNPPFIYFTAFVNFPTPIPKSHQTRKLYHLALGFSKQHQTDNLLTVTVSNDTYSHCFTCILAIESNENNYNDIDNDSDKLNTISATVDLNSDT